MPDTSPLRSAKVAAASAGSLKRTSSVRVSDPAVSATSRSMPPQEMEASWRSSPMVRTLAPRALATAITVSSSRVPASPVSSTMISVRSLMLLNQRSAALSLWAMSWGPVAMKTSLATVSVSAPPRSWRSTSAAAAVGAKPKTVPPESCQARESTSMAVVFPDPAGARASCRRAPLVAISRTRVAWPSLSSRPSWLAAYSTRASSTMLGSMARPFISWAAATMRCSAATISCEVYSWVLCVWYTDCPSRRRKK
ncbi:Uncharacterised protein [Mycobacteroides abscessus subsp. abscessus]|nr:Uncharacterised protein [Mycobacteroides abscessus subsp. abscessus]SKW97044.1 Uncharacterised protein [Mycobacteroides abscessus subsp. abscessus]